MAAGDVTITNLGTYDISGASLTAVTTNITTSQFLSGARLFFVPNGNNNSQVTVLKTEMA